MAAPLPRRQAGAEAGAGAAVDVDTDDALAAGTRETVKQRWSPAGPGQRRRAQMEQRTR